MAVFGRKSRRADNDLPRCSPRRSLHRACCNSAVQVDHVDQPTQLGSRSSHVRERSTRLESRRTVKPDHGVRTRVPGCCHVIGCYAKGGGQTVNRLMHPYIIHITWAIGLASATSQLDGNAWQRVATYKSGSKQTWRRIFFV